MEGTRPSMVSLGIVSWDYQSLNRKQNSKKTQLAVQFLEWDPGGANSSRLAQNITGLKVQENICFET